MTKAYKGAHYDGLDGKDRDDEAGKPSILFLVYFSLNWTEIIGEWEKFFWGSMTTYFSPKQIWSDYLAGIYSNKIKTFRYFLSTFTLF